MRLYDFSVYAKRREVQRAAQAVGEAASHAHQPGAVLDLKEKVVAWLALHRDIIKKSA